MKTSKIPPDLATFLRDELGDSGDASAADIVVRGKVWLWTGMSKDGTPAKGSWFFLTIDGDTATAVRAAAAGRSGGWGSVKIVATLGGSTWSTSLFPSKERGGYLLPLKASVRKKERVEEGDVIEVMVKL